MEILVIGAVSRVKQNKVNSFIDQWHLHPGNFKMRQIYNLIVYNNV